MLLMKRKLIGQLRQTIDGCEWINRTEMKSNMEYIGLRQVLKSLKIPEMGKNCIFSSETNIVPNLGICVMAQIT